MYGGLGNSVGQSCGPHISLLGDLYCLQGFCLLGVCECGHGALVTAGIKVMCEHLG